MLHFFSKPRKNKELDEILQQLHMNASNNYKDAAQQNLAEFENRLKSLTASGKISGAQQAYYENILLHFKDQMKNFTHKDQKPYWI